MNFVAFLIAAILFFVAAVTEPDHAEFIAWGFGFLALGHLLGSLPFNWPNRQP